MSSVRTSAGDSEPEPVSMATLCRTASGVTAWPRPATADSSVTTRSARATSAGSPDKVTALPRTWMSAARLRSRARRFSSADPSRPTTMSGGTSMLLRTVLTGAAFVSRGVTWVLLPAFCACHKVCESNASLASRVPGTQWLMLPTWWATGRRRTSVGPGNESAPKPDNPESIVAEWLHRIRWHISNSYSAPSRHALAWTGQSLARRA